MVGKMMINYEIRGTRGTLFSDKFTLELNRGRVGFQITTNSAHVCVISLRSTSDNVPTQCDAHWAMTLSSFFGVIFLLGKILSIDPIIRFHASPISKLAIPRWLSMRFQSWVSYILINPISILNWTHSDTGKSRPSILEVPWTSLNLKPNAIPARHNPQLNHPHKSPIELVKYTTFDMWQIMSLITYIPMYRTFAGAIIHSKHN